MNEHLIFEQKNRGHNWRLDISTFKGRTFANWRKWYLCDGGWKPTREGCIIPLERLEELQASLTAYCEAEGLRGS
jgi:hypothetical protein